MTTRIAIALFLLILALIALDTLILETGNTLALLRRGFDLLQSMAFWR